MASFLEALSRHKILKNHLWIMLSFSIGLRQEEIFGLQGKVIKKKDSKISLSFLTVHYLFLSIRQTIKAHIKAQLYLTKGFAFMQTLEFLGGDEGNRTPDLLNANQALSHLSYAPIRS